MVEKRTCDYTGEDIEPGTGIMYVQKDGTVLHFVDSKAEKNYKLGREPRDLEWTEAGRQNKGPVQEQPEEGDEADADAEDEAEEDVDAEADEE
ncbi:50S ribosomal protein L24e [Natrialbaceae archaeon A-gly3]